MNRRIHTISWASAAGVATISSAWAQAGSALRGIRNVVHGAWADGSSSAKVVSLLEAKADVLKAEL